MVRRRAVLDEVIVVIDACATSGGFACNIFELFAFLLLNSLVVACYNITHCTKSVHFKLVQIQLDVMQYSNNYRAMAAVA